MRNKYKLLFKNTLIFTLGNLGSKIIAFFLVPLYTNFLTTEEYGISDMIFTIAQVLVPILSLMVTSGIFRFGLSKDYNEKDVLKSGLKICIPGLLLMPLISLLLSIYKPISQWVWYLCGYVIFQILGSVGLSYLKVKGKNGAYAIISVFQTFIIASCNVLFLAIWKIGIEGYLLSSLISSVVTTMASFISADVYNDISSAKTNSALSKLMIAYSAPLIINELSWWIIHSCDKLMINEMIGGDALGIYSIAARIPSFITVIVSIFSSAWGISTIKEYEETKDSGFYETVFKYYSFINFLVAIAIIAVVKEFMNIYVGNSFFVAWKYVPFLICSTVYASFCNFYGSLYSALKKSVDCMYTSLVSAIINVVLNYLLINRYEIYGAVVASALACFVAMLIRVRYINRTMHMHLEKSFVANNILLLLETVSITFEFHPMMVSVFVAVLFVLNNQEMVNYLFKAVFEKIYSIFTRSQK